MPVTQSAERSPQATEQEETQTKSGMSTLLMAFLLLPCGCLLLCCVLLLALVMASAVLNVAALVRSGVATREEVLYLETQILSQVLEFELK